MTSTVQLRYKHSDLYGNVPTRISLITHEEGLGQLMQEIRRFLIATGYSAESVNAYIEEN